MPTFCRHNRLIQNCPICAREQDIEPRPLVSSSSPGALGRTSPPGASPASSGLKSGSPPAIARRRAAAGRVAAGGGVTVRRVRSTVDDGYHSPLVPGLKSTREAERLAVELAFAAARLDRLEHAPPELYAEVADPAGDLEERTWLAFLIAYLGPLEETEDPFEAIGAARTSWASGEVPSLEVVQTGPRTAHQPEAGPRTLEAYRAWAERAGSQAAAFGGDAGWTQERRFARVFERLALPGLHRAARYDLLVTLGRMGLYGLRADALVLGGSEEVTVGAKRAFGIGDVMLLERRARQLADGCGIPLEALDLGLFNWERGTRCRAGMPAEVAPDPEVLQAATEALGL